MLQNVFEENVDFPKIKKLKKFLLMQKDEK